MMKNFLHLGAKLPWKRNLALIQEEGWSKSILIYQIDTDLYKRQVSTIKHNNFELILKQNSDLADNMMKEPYVFDLIELTDDYKER